MNRERLVRQLEKAANHIADVPREDLQVLLRRAALMLRNLGHGLDVSREKDPRSADESDPDPNGPPAA